MGANRLLEFWKRKLHPLISTRLRENFSFNLVYCLLIFSYKYVNLFNAWTFRLLEKATYIFFHTQSLVAERYHRLDHSLVNHLMNLCCSNRLIIDFKLSIWIIYYIYKHIRTLTELELSYGNIHLSHRPKFFAHALPYHWSLRYSPILNSPGIYSNNSISHYYSRFTSIMINR